MTDSQLVSAGMTVLFAGFALGVVLMFAMGMALGIVNFIRDMLGWGA